MSKTTKFLGGPLPTWPPTAPQVPIALQADSSQKYVDPKTSMPLSKLIVRLTKPLAVPAYSAAVSGLAGGSLLATWPCSAADFIRFLCSSWITWYEISRSDSHRPTIWNMGYKLKFLNEVFSRANLEWLKNAQGLMHRHVATVCGFHQNAQK